jgi:polyhydroxyalkanoate synthesis regulator phasin
MIQVAIVGVGMLVGVIGFFLKRMVDALDRISNDIGDIKTSMARHEEKHDALSERVLKLENQLA